jgi:hypothetical protein
MTQYVDEDFVNKQKDLRPIGFIVTLDQYKKYENIAREAGYCSRCPNNIFTKSAKRTVMHQH